MFTKIQAKNFKGLSFEQPLARLNLFIGMNGSGKSARSGALLLARFGFIPGNGGKKNSDIFQAYSGSGANQITVGFSTDKGGVLERHFLNRSTGTVSQKYSINGTYNRSAEDFAMAMANVPKVFDLSEFMALSDQKKIDLIFELFPPAGGDPVALSIKIGEKEATLNRKREELRGAEKIVQKLTSSKAEIQLPAGNLSLTKSRIEGLNNALKTAKAELAEAQKAEIEAQAKIKAEADAKAETEKRILEATAKAKMEAAIKPQPEPPSPIETARQKAEQSLMQKNDRAGIGHMPTAAGSIQRILDTLAGAGCDVCAAVMVAKAELKKHQQGEMRF